MFTGTGEPNRKYVRNGVTVSDNEHAWKRKAVIRIENERAYEMYGKVAIGLEGYSISCHWIEKESKLGLTCYDEKRPKWQLQGNQINLENVV